MSILSKTGTGTAYFPDTSDFVLLCVSYSAWLVVVWPVLHDALVYLSYQTAAQYIS